MGDKRFATFWKNVKENFCQRIFNIPLSTSTTPVAFSIHEFHETVQTSMRRRKLNIYVNNIARSHPIRVHRVVMSGKEMGGRLLEMERSRRFPCPFHRNIHFSFLRHSSDTHARYGAHLKCPISCSGLAQLIPSRPFHQGTRPVD